MQGSSNKPKIRNKPGEDIFLCMAISLSGAFFWYDKYYGFMGVMRIVTAVLLVIVWIWCGFISGKNRTWGFMIFAVSYWSAPYLYMMYYNSRDNVRGYSKWLSLLNKLSDLVFNKPLLIVAECFKKEPVIPVLFLLVLTAISYVFGCNIAYVIRKNSEEDEDDAGIEGDNSAISEQSDEEHLDN